MNNRERALHFQFFAHVCQRLGWTECGRALADAPAGMNYHALRAWHRAAAIAAHDQRPPRMDDLRHAVYQIAAGVHSTKQLTNPRLQARVTGYLLLCLNDTDPAGHQLCPLPRANPELR